MQQKRSEGERGEGEGRGGEARGESRADLVVISSCKKTGGQKRKNTSKMTRVAMVTVLCLL